MNEILDFLNTKIREEHGNRVTLDSKWTDAELDSFGTVMVLADMDNEYECFNREWMASIDFTTLTVLEVVERAINESPKL